MPGIGCDFQQCVCTGFEEQREELPLVLPHQRHQCVRHAEDQMIVAYGQQFLLALGEPLVASVGLALGAVPGTAGVERDGLMAALATAIQMTAERWSSNSVRASRATGGRRVRKTS